MCGLDSTRPPSAPFLVVGLSVLLGVGSAWVAAAQEGAAYRVGPRDKVEIQVAEIPDFDDEFEVNDLGNLDLPFVGTVEVRGMTEQEIEAELRQRLEAQGVRRASVSVRVTGYFSRPVSLLGAIAEPGSKIVPGKASLLQVLLEAGGLSEGHNGVILVRRQASNGLSDQVEIPAEELFELGEPAVNIPIFAGDVVHVPAARSIEVSFLGQVNNSGSVKFRSNERATLLVAIVRAGGLSETASSKIRILRTVDGEREEIVANYRRILNGKDPDVELLDGDIVVVKESFF